MEIFSYGNMDFLFEIFSAVTGVMGTSSFATLVRLTILLGFLVLAYQTFFSLRIDIVAAGFLKQYIAIIVIFYALFVPKSNVIIRDEIKNQQVTANNVPFGVALTANLMTTAERGITNLMETYFSTPNDLRFGRSGYAFSVMVIDNLKYGTPLDPYFKRTMNGYIVDCFFNDVLMGDKDLNGIVNSNDLFSDIAPQSSQSMQAMLYNVSAPQGSRMTCTNVYQSMQTNMGTITTAAQNQLNLIIGTDLSSKLGVAGNMLLGVSMSSTEMISQAITANAMSEGMAQMALYSGTDANALMYAAALSSHQQRSSWAVGGELSKKYIPILRQILEAFVYGLFPVLFVMMMTPLWSKALSMYFSLLVWLLMWSPMYAILNLIINTRATGVLSATNGFFCLGKMPFIYESTNDLVAMAGYIAWLVPTISFAVAKGSDYALTNLASSIGGSTNLTQHQAAAAITGTEGARRAATAAAHFQAASLYGFDGAAQALAARSFYDMSSGHSWANRGDGAMISTADSVVGGTRGGAEANMARARVFQMTNVDQLSDWQGRGAPMGEVGKALESNGIISRAAIEKFGMEGAMVTGSTVDENDRIKHMTAVSSDGSRLMEFSGGRMAMSGIVNEKDLDRFRSQALSADMNRIASEMQSGMEYSFIYDKDGNMARANLSRGGKMVEEDSVRHDKAESGAFTSNDLSIKTAEGSTMNLKDAYVRSEGGMNYIAGIGQDGSWVNVSLASKTGPTGNQQIGEISGTMMTRDEKRGSSADKVLTAEETRQVADDIRAMDPQAARELDKIAVEGKSVSLNSKGDLSDRSYAYIAAHAGAVAMREDKGIEQTASGAHTSGTMTRSDMESLRDEAVKNGHNNFARFLNGMLSEMGPHRENETFAIDMWRGLGGQVAAARIEHGMKAHHYDEGSRTWGTTDIHGDMKVDRNFSGTIDGHKFQGVKTDYGSGYSSLSGAFTTPGGQSFAGHAELRKGHLVFSSGERGQSLTTADINRSVVGRGTDYQLGNDLVGMMFDNDHRGMYQSYGSFFQGNAPTQGGRALVDRMANSVGGYGSIKQALIDALDAQAGASFSLKDSKWGGVITKVTGLSADAGVHATKRALEQIDVDTLKMKFQDHYSDVMRQNKSPEWKAGQMSKLGNQLINLMMQHGEKHTIKQMFKAAPNPLKEEGLKPSKSEE